MARNVGTRYFAIAFDAVVGLIMLPYNVAHLGPAAYGLWALVASVSMYFSALDLGYGSALVKFIAMYRARRDRESLNQVLSTVWVLYTAIGAVTFAAVCVVAWQFGTFFKVSPEQIETGRQVLLIIGSYVAIRFGVGLFGAVVYGFQRYYRNNLISIITTSAVAATNFAVLDAGFGLVPLVAATTSVRALSLGVVVWMAFRAYPGMSINPRLFRRERLREVTGFSVYMLVLDWSAKLNYSVDALVIGSMIGTASVAVWTVAQRIAEVSEKLSNQLNAALFPIIVDSDAVQRRERLQQILIHATRFSLALATPICVGLAIVAAPLIHAWVGERFAESVAVLRLLLCVVLIKMGNAAATLILKGAGKHRLLAGTNSTTAVVNVLLSVALLPHFGLVGVALGTLIPVGSAAVFVLFPAACRRVGMPVAHAVSRAIWPAAWPVVGLCAVLWMGQRFEPSSLSALAAQLVIAGSVYEALFLCALPANERRWYWTKVTGLLRRRRRLPAAA